MTIRFGKIVCALFPTIALFAMSSQTMASTLNQNVSWTIDRTGTTAKYRVVAYGDSIYAGYNGSTTNAAKYSAPTIESEYLSSLWNADIESVRRTKSGAVASDVYNNKIVAEKSYMQAASTRVVTFEMCGNDGLQARSSFKGQTGTCNYSVLTTAENNCKTYVAAAMDYINANAYSGTKLKIIGNLYYPGYNADNVQSSCNDPSTGAKVNMRDDRISLIAHELIVPDFSSANGNRPLAVSLPTRQCTIDKVSALKQVLARHPGTTQIYLRLISGERITTLELDQGLRVTPSSALMGDLKALLGPGCLGG